MTILGNYKDSFVGNYKGNSERAAATNQWVSTPKQLIPVLSENKKLSNPQCQVNASIGFDLKMTLHTTTTETQCRQYLSCNRPNFDDTLKVGSWEHLEQIPSVTVTFVQATLAW